MVDLAGLSAAAPGFMQHGQQRAKDLHLQLQNQRLVQQLLKANPNLFQGQVPGAQPMPQTPAPGQPSMPRPMTQGAMPQQAAAAQPILPPAAMQALKEGHITTFNNGQKWTLRNGQPEQVDLPANAGPTQGRMPPGIEGRPEDSNSWPPTPDEFKRQFGRDPATDSEVEFYYLQDLNRKRAQLGLPELDEIPDPGFGRAMLGQRIRK